jgi:hypothetical protein
LREGGDHRTARAVVDRERQLIAVTTQSGQHAACHRHPTCRGQHADRDGRKYGAPTASCARFRVNSPRSVAVRVDVATATRERSSATAARFSWIAKAGVGCSASSTNASTSRRIAAAIPFVETNGVAQVQEPVVVDRQFIRDGPTEGGAGATVSVSRSVESSSRRRRLALVPTECRWWPPPATRRAGRTPAVVHGSRPDRRAAGATGQCQRQAGWARVGPAGRERAFRSHRGWGGVGVHRNRTGAVQVFEEYFGGVPPHIDDDFFSLGLDSILSRRPSM